MQNKEDDRCQVLSIRELRFLFFLLSFFILRPSSFILAQPHTRLYACAIGSDSVGASMGGSSMGAGLWQSDDTAKTWKQIGWKHVKCYSVDVVQKSNGKKIYLACGNGVMRSTDAGATWRMLTDWRITEVMDVAIDQQVPKNIYIATPGAIWKSNDGGDNWYEADSDIPYPIFASRITIDPKNHLKIYAAIDTTIYISNDGGLAWKNSITNTAAVHDFVVCDMKRIAGVDSIGILEWKEENTGISSTMPKVNPYHYESPIFIYRFMDGMTTAIPGVSMNIHSIISIGGILFASLNGGIWKYEYSPDMPTKAGLDLLQIWRLKAVEIK